MTHKENATEGVQGIGGLGTPVPLIQATVPSRGGWSPDPHRKPSKNTIQDEQTLYLDMRMSATTGSRKCTRETRDEQPENTLPAFLMLRNGDRLDDWIQQMTLTPKWHLVKSNIYSKAFYHLVTKNF